MSKRFIALLIGTVLFLTASILVAESRKIEQPILIPIGVQAINILNENNNFTLSYITNRNEQVHVAMVYAGTEVLHSNSNNSFDFFSNQMSNPYTILRAYKYHELHEQQIEINEFQLENVRKYLQENETVKVIFSDGTSIDYPLALHFYEHQSENKVIQFEYRQSMENRISEADFKMKQNATIEEIDSTFTNATIELFKGEQQLSLPYEAQVDDKLTLRIAPNERLGFSTIYLAFLKGTLATGEPFAENDLLQAGDIPSEEWVRNYLQEVGED